MKNLVKDLFAVCFSYFLAYLALYVLLLIILGLFPFPLYIKNQLLDLFVPIYGIMFVMLWMKRKHIDVSCIKNPFSLNQETIKDVAAVFGINIGLTWIISLVLGLFIAVEGNIDLSELMGNSILIIIANGILAPIDEEFFFRVFLMNSLEKHGRWKAAVLISAAFALAHINPLAVISAFFISMCLFALRFKYNSIWPCAMVHICINTFNQLSALTENLINPANFVLIAAVLYSLVYLFQKRRTIKTEFMECFQDKLPQENESSI